MYFNAIDACLLAAECLSGKTLDDLLYLVPSHLMRYSAVAQAEGTYCRGRPQLVAIDCSTVRLTTPVPKLDDETCSVPLDCLSSPFQLIHPAGGLQGTGQVCIGLIAYLHRCGAALMDTPDAGANHPCPTFCL